MPRTNTEVVSQLPSYSAKPSKDFPGWLIVTCPYEDCDDVFLVRKSHWVRPLKRSTHKGSEFTVTGRSCPYCFRVAHIPGRLAR
jgi:hypothetical protein